ncbi:hypothetical protein BN2475_1250017 [Paraburkholderia ribeironis]|uniref:DUF3800 domain-containing protein n=1 Tax=Paraburkholderia ribeironis TaxID=1247936 RepID=A0A1N7SNR5_9BURK|nr:DUF3800 domain-containing protein [Paraburkholderia ribeironis]SIT49080.1 hypothetical protein BN2475_1250017 [Paraburkholderia ribeironis]
MILITYLDESGTHDSSPITVMAGYLATSAQWDQFDADWRNLVRAAGVQHVHAVDLFKRTRQFRNWKAADANRFAIALDRAIARHLPVGFAVIVRDDDYRNIYGAAPQPKRARKDTKYAVCFRACLAFVPEYIASGLKFAADATIINFVLEDGHRHIGDARRLFDLYKTAVSPEWRQLVGSMDVSTKGSSGAQAADFLAYTVYRTEILEHSHAPSVIEHSSHVADTLLTARTTPHQATQQTGPAVFRIPIGREILQSLKDDLFRSVATTARES